MDSIKSKRALTRIIRQGLVERDISQAEIAREAGTSRQAVNATITGDGYGSARIRELICKIMGWDNWPKIDGVNQPVIRDDT